MADKARCLRWIIGELPELEQRQLISAEQKAGLLEYYSGRLAQVRSQKNTSASKYFGFMLWLTALKIQSFSMRLPENISA